MKRLTRTGLFVALFLVAFVLGLRLTFPMKMVTRILESQIADAVDHKFEVSIERTRFAGLIGLRMTNVELRPVSDGDELRLPLRLDRVQVNASALSLLKRRPGAVADVRIDDGRARVTWATTEEGGNTLRVELFSMELRRIPQVREAVKMPVAGAVSGTIMLSYDPHQVLRRGDIELGVSSLVFGPGDIQNEIFRPFGGSIPIPATRFGNVVLRMPIEGTTYEIQQVEASGADIRLEASGTLQQRDPMRNSRIDLEVQFQLDGEYVEEAGLGAVFALPDLQRLQTGDGYAFSLSGPLGHPSLVPNTRRGL